jgi:hypothetical protein
MKLFKAALIMSALLLCWVVNGYADRLYRWTDAQGVIHITQDPPPDTAKEVDTFDYSPQPNPPMRQPTASDQTYPQQGNLDQGGGQSGSGTGGNFASGNEENDVQYQYEGGPYRQTLRQYERRGERLDNNEQGKKGDLPVRVHPHPRRR